MIIRDARGEVHDLGPRRTLEVSTLRIASGYGDEESGGWKGHAHLFERRERAPLPPRPPRIERDRAYRAANLDHVRQLERERQARRRARLRAMVGA